MSLSVSTNPGGYGGVKSPNPPTVWFVPRDPTVNDWQNFSLMDEWCNIAQGVVRWFKLLSLENNQGIWIRQDSTDTVNGLVMQTGTSPVLPNIVTGYITLSGAVVAAGTNPIRSDGTGPNTATIEVQISQAIASTNAANIGLSAYNSAHFTVDANGFVSLLGGGQAIDSLTPNSGTTPIVPDVSGNVNLLGTGSITVVGSLNTGTIQLTGLTNHAVLVGAGTATITNVGPTATTGQVLQNNAGADPSYSTATYPSTTTINQILYSSSNNVVGGITASANGVLISSNTNVPSWLANSGTPGFVLTANAGAPPSWQANAGGDVSGPGSSTNRALATWNGTTGTLLFDNPGTTLDATGNLSMVQSVPGTNLTLAIQNTSNTAGSIALLYLRSGGTTAKASEILFDNTTTFAYAAGMLASDGSFRISSGSGGIGTGTDVVTISQAGLTTFGIGDVYLQRSASGSTPLILVSNTSNTASSNSSLFLQTAGSSSGVPYIYMSRTNVTNYAIGVGTSGGGDNLQMATNADLTTGLFFKANSTGQITKPAQSSFLAYLSAAVTNVTGDGTSYTIAWNSTVSNVNSNFNTGTFTYTAPVTGNYPLYTQIVVSNLNVAHTAIYTFIQTSNRIYNMASQNPFPSSNGGGIVFSTTPLPCDMDAADTATVVVAVSGSTKTVGIGGGSSQASFFGGYLSH